MREMASHNHHLGGVVAGAISQVIQSAAPKEEESCLENHTSSIELNVNTVSNTLYTSNLHRKMITLESYESDTAVEATEVNDEVYISK